MVADGNRRGYTEVLEHFWTNACNWGLKLPQSRPVSAAAFCKARRKLPSSLLRDLLKIVNGRFVQDFGSRYQWRGRRVFAIDGTKLNVKATEELGIKFGKPHCGRHPQVLVCTLYDVLSELPVDQVQLPCNCDERFSFDSLLDHLSAGDLLILDAGYPSFGVFQELMARGIDFLIRVPAFFSTVSATRHDRVIKQGPPKNNPEHTGADPIELRALRVEIDGKSRFFVTTLPKTTASHRELTQLYRKRWNIEELYKALKDDTIGQNLFRSETSDGVIQELLLSALYVAISRYLCAATRASDPVAQDGVEIRDSLKTAVLALSDSLAILILDTASKRRHQALLGLLQRITRGRHRHRPGRSFPRRSLKPLPRWDHRGSKSGRKSRLRS